MKTLYVDLDGVLVDWVTSAVAKVNERLSEQLEKKYLQSEENDLAYEVRNYYKRNYITPNEMINDRYTSSPLAKFCDVVLRDNQAFWSYLSFTYWGRSLWKTILSLKKQHYFSVKILTTPMDKYSPGTGCKAGKLLWVLNNLGGDVEVLFSRHKEHYAKNKDVPNFLIDDQKELVSSFQKAGGKAFKIYSQPLEPIDYLDDLAKEIKEWAES